MVQIPYKLWQSIYALIWGPLKWRISKRPSLFWLGYWFLHLPSLSCVNINRTHLFSKQSFQFRGVDVDWLHLSFDDPPLLHPSKPTTFSNMHININFNIMIWASILIIRLFLIASDENGDLDRSYKTHTNTRTDTSKAAYKKLCKKSKLWSVKRLFYKNL